MRKLIVNADDFGQSPGINEGIIRAHQEGILTSASLMVRYAFVTEAVDYSRSTNIGLGLHVDLGEWKYVNNEWIAVYDVVDFVDETDVRKEVERQINLFIRLTGKNPTHIDSHQHVHMRKNVLPVFIEFAKKLNVTLRKYSDAVKYCGDFYGQSSDYSSMPQNVSVENLCRIISNTGDGITEIACHPATKIEIDTMYRDERIIETESLCDDRVKNKIREENIRLISFDGIPFQFDPEVEV